MPTPSQGQENATHLPLWRWDGGQQTISAKWILQKREGKYRKWKVGHDEYLLWADPELENSKYSMTATRTMDQGKSTINTLRYGWRSCCNVPHGVRLPADNIKAAVVWIRKRLAGIHLLAITTSGRNQGDTSWRGKDQAGEHLLSWMLCQAWRTSPEAACRATWWLRPWTINTENSRKVAIHCGTEKGEVVKALLTGQRHFKSWKK